jgi:hypothetical protein
VYLPAAGFAALVAELLLMVRRYPSRTILPSLLVAVLTLGIVARFALLNRASLAAYDELAEPFRRAVTLWPTRDPAAALNQHRALHLDPTYDPFVADYAAVCTAR